MGVVVCGIKTRLEPMVRNVKGVIEKTRSDEGVSQVDLISLKRGDPCKPCFFFMRII
jgi:hypothetical protein